MGTTSTGTDGDWGIKLMCPRAAALYQKGYVRGHETLGQGSWKMTRCQLLRL